MFTYIYIPATTRGQSPPTDFISKQGKWTELRIMSTYILSVFRCCESERLRVQPMTDLHNITSRVCEMPCISNTTIMSAHAQ